MVFEVAGFDSVVKIELKSFLCTLDPILAQNLGLTRNGWSYGLADVTIVSLVEYTKVEF